MDELSFQALCRAVIFPDQPLVFWLGAGASYSSGVPLAAEIVQKLRQQIPSAFDEARKKFSTQLDVDEPTLEMLLHVYKEEQGRETVMKFLHDCGIPGHEETRTPGIGYRLIAHLAKHGALKYIVSMNFDEVLEKALDTVLTRREIGDATDHERSYWRACRHEDFKRLHNTMVKNETLPRLILLKLHGTISDYAGMMATRADVEKLAEEKQEILKKIFEIGRHAIFIGYQCADPDIIQVFQQIYSTPHPHNIYWVDYKPLRELLGIRSHLKRIHPLHRVFGRFERSTADDFLVRMVEHVSEVSRTSPASTIQIPGVADLSLKYMMQCMTSGNLSQVEKLRLDWMIAAALDNGIFDARELVRRTRDLEIAYSISPHQVHQTLEDLINAGILLRINRDYYCLADIDDYVMPKLRELFRLRRLTKTRRQRIRDYLKDLAQRKAPKGSWSVPGPDGALFKYPVKLENLPKMERKTIQVIQDAKVLKVVSEYGTWLRREPFRRFVRDFLKVQQRVIEAILVEPPPYESEGYNEWCESVYVLSEWGVQIYFMNREKHENHMTLGNGEAISFERDLTNHRLRPAFVDAPSDIEKLEKEVYVKYKQHESTVSLHEWLERSPIAIRGDDFEILVTDEFDRESVIGKWDPKAKRKTTEKIDRDIETAWQRAEQEARTQKRSLFPGPLCRLTEYGQQCSQLHMTFGLTDYKEFMGTNKNPKVVKRAGEEYLSNPTAVCVTLLTKDKKILVGRRSQRTMEHPGRWHVPGGHIDPNKHISGDRVDVFRAILDEIQEEIGCPPNDVETLMCLGLIRPRDTLKPELAFFGQLHKSWPEISSYPRNEEHQEFHSIPNLPDELLDFLRQHTSAFAPVGKGCLLLYGKWAYGSEWFFEAVDRLRAVKTQKRG